MSNSAGKKRAGEWRHLVAIYQEPSRGRAIWQIINTLLPHALLGVSIGPA
jgi:hypothetical protein